MCGIAGLIAVPGDHGKAANQMLVALRHRGPDDEGMKRIEQQTTLLHTRLAILDLSPDGHQPMADHPDNGLAENWLVFNGEIFNFRELQSELAQQGWPCRTQSDTEVILHGYRVWGEKFVERFRGMFAFCLVDRGRGIVHLYRDRLGIKPLYLYRSPQGGLIFASELRAILTLGPEFLNRHINPVALESFLAQGAIQGYSSIIKGVELLEPAKCLTVDLATGIEQKRNSYWQLPLAVDEHPKRKEAVNDLASLLREAIKLRLISDVPLGLFLSGGIDSASLLALASEHNQQTRTVCVGFDIADFDESRQAIATAEAFGAHHTTLTISGQEVLTSMPEVLSAMDQPTVDGMNTFVVSRAAKQAGLTVALSGLGGDELFGGYASFSDVPRFLRWHRFLRIGRLAERLKHSRAFLKLREAFRRPANELNLYLLRRELFLPQERRALVPDLPTAACEFTGLDRTLLADLQQRGALLDGVNRISLFELELYMRHMLLRDGDAFSMAAPIEYRVPFLDHKLVEAVFRLPGAWKQKDPRPKPLLLDAIGNRLPKSIWQRRKQGFAFPWGKWFGNGGALVSTAQSAVQDIALWKELGINPQSVSTIWKRFAIGDKRVSPLQILAFVTLRDYAVRHNLRAA